MNLTRATTRETFFQTERARGHQISLTIEFLPSNNLKTGSLGQGYKYQVGNSVLFQSLEATMYGEENGFNQVVNVHLAVVSYLDKLVQPSYTLFKLIMPQGLLKAS